MQGAEASNLYNLLLQKLGTDYSADKIKGDFSHTPHLLIWFSIKLLWDKNSIFICRWQIWSYDASSYSKRWSSHNWNWVAEERIEGSLYCISLSKFSILSQLKVVLHTHTNKDECIGLDFLKESSCI